MLRAERNHIRWNSEENLSKELFRESGQKTQQGLLRHAGTSKNGAVTTLGLKTGESVTGAWGTGAMEEGLQRLFLN